MILWETNGHLFNLVILPDSSGSRGAVELLGPQNELCV